MECHKGFDHCSINMFIHFWLCLSCKWKATALFFCTLRLVPSSSVCRGAWAVPCHLGVVKGKNFRRDNFGWLPKPCNRSENLLMFMKEPLLTFTTSTGFLVFRQGWRDIDSSVRIHELQLSTKKLTEVNYSKWPACFWFLKMLNADIALFLTGMKVRYTTGPNLLKPRLYAGKERRDASGACEDLGFATSYIPLKSWLVQVRGSWIQWGVVHPHKPTKTRVVFHCSYEQCSKPRLVVLYRGLYYPVI